MCAVPVNNGFPLCNPGGLSFFQGNNSGGFDSFIAKLTTTQGLVWSSFIGGDRDETYGIFGSGVNNFLHTNQKIIVNDDDDIIIVGNTLSGTTGSVIDYPATVSPTYFSSNIHGDQTGAVNADAYFTMFDGTTQEILHTSYFGGKGLDNVGNVSFFQDKVYMTGGSQSTTAFPINCPATFPNPYCQSIITGGTDAFISQLRLDGLTGIDENDKDNSDFFTISPNPSNNNINISFVANGNYDVEIMVYDLIGKTLVSKTIKKQSHNFNARIGIADFSNGVYFVQLNLNGNTYSSKFIKQ